VHVRPLHDHRSKPAPVLVRSRSCYEEEGLFPLLEVFVLSHPLAVSVGKANVVGLRPADSLQPMRNAFSFERIRRVTAKAIRDAGLPDVAP
jgi:hypothetical protein